MCASACAGGEGGWQKIALLGGESLRRVFIASPASQESSPPAPDTPAQTGEKTVLGRGPRGFTGGQRSAVLKGQLPACCPAPAFLTPSFRSVVLKGQLLCCCCTRAFLAPARETRNPDGWVFLPPVPGQPTCSSQPSQPTLRAKFREPRAVSAPAPRARCSTTRFPRSPLPEGLRKGEGERSLQRTLALSQLPPNAAFPPPPMSQASLPFAAGAAGAHWGRPSLLKGTGDSGPRFYGSLGRAKSVATGTSVYSLTQFGSPENKPICLPSFLWSSGLQRRQRAQIRLGTVHIHMIMYS